MEGQPDAFDSQMGQADMLQALRSASLPDEFWMYSYKILPCPHGYRHSWTHCPFSHAGETARRRCPRTHQYLPDPCVNARAKRQCPNGDACPYAHSTFEQWLHPARYRTRLCYLGANCRRPTCFFAHSVEELRSVEESESGSLSGGHQPTMPALPIPPPLPTAAFNDGSYINLPSAPPPVAATPPPLAQPGAHPAPPAPKAVAPSAAASAAAAHGPAATTAPAGPPMPMGLFQPIALVCMPQPPQAQMALQPHQMIRPEIMAAGAPQGYVTFQTQPGVPRPPQAQSVPSDSAGPHTLPAGVPMMPVPVPPQTMMPLALRPQPRLHHPGQTVALATMHGGQIQFAPAGPMYIHGGAGPMHGPLPRPPHGYTAAPYSAGAAGYYPVIHPAGEGVPPSGAQGRTRSWSNPGESSNYPAGPAAGGAAVHNGQRGYYNGDQASGAGWSTTSEASRRAGGLPTGVSAVPMSALTPTSPPPHSSRGTTAPRHMPAPTNRGNAVRRVSTPASLPAADVNATAVTAAAATAAVAAMRYSGADAPGGRAVDSLVLPCSLSNGASSSMSPPHAHATFMPQVQPQKPQMVQAGGGGSLEATFQSMSLTKHMAAPPPTPAAGTGSSFSGALSLSTMSSVPLAARTSATGLAAVMADADVAAPGGGAVDATFPHWRTSVGDRSSRPSSASSRDSGAGLGVFDSAAAGAASSDAPTDAVAAVSMPYHVLLQHVLRSTSASAAEPALGLLPALLKCGGCADLSDSSDVYYDDIDGPERTSDPGPRGLRAAIRRISTELGSAVACRNSDPGQSVPTNAAGVQQLLLPLLQSVLTEGLATGQFELINGQLQVKAPAASGLGVSSGARSPGGSGIEAERTGSGVSVGNGPAGV